MFLGKIWTIIRKSFLMRLILNLVITQRHFLHHSLHIQNTKGINAPMATKIGNIAGDSSFSYGSRVFGPLGFLLLKNHDPFLINQVIGYMKRLYKIMLGIIWLFLIRWKFTLACYLPLNHQAPNHLNLQNHHLSAREAAAAKDSWSIRKRRIAGNVANIRCHWGIYTFSILYV